MEQKSRKPRGRPRQFDEATLLERARALFWEQGFQATSLGEIAAATGVHKPSLYGAYETKTRLFLKTLDLYRAEAGDRIADAFSREPLAAALKAFFATDIALFAGKGPRGCYVMNVAGPAGREDKEIGAAATLAWTALSAAVAARIARASAEELPAGMSAQALADLTMAVHLALATRARAGDPPALLKPRADALLGLVPGRPRRAGARPTGR